jgi:hypothetical protein
MSDDVITTRHTNYPALASQRPLTRPSRSALFSLRATATAAALAAITTAAFPASSLLPISAGHRLRILAKFPTQSCPTCSTRWRSILPILTVPTATSTRARSSRLASVWREAPCRFTERSFHVIIRLTRLPTASVRSVTELVPRPVPAPDPPHLRQGAVYGAGAVRPR